MLRFLICITAFSKLPNTNLFVADRTVLRVDTIKRGDEMKGKIAVEQNLTPVKDYLTGKGYEVDCIRISDENTAKLAKYDAIVVNGLSNNMLGVQDTMTSAVVINASGMTPEEIGKEIESSKGH